MAGKTRTVRDRTPLRLCIGIMFSPLYRIDCFIVRQWIVYTPGTRRCSRAHHGELRRSGPQRAPPAARSRLRTGTLIAGNPHSAIGEAGSMRCVRPGAVGKQRQKRATRTANAAPTQTREHGRSIRRLSSRLTSGRSTTAAEDAHFFTDARREWDEHRQSQGFGVGPVVLWVESFC